MVVSLDLNELMRFYVEKYGERNISSEKELADFLQAFLASDAQIYLVDLQRQVVNHQRQVEEKDAQIERLRMILRNREERIKELKSESELNASGFASTYSNYTYDDPDHGRD